MDRLRDGLLTIEEACKFARISRSRLYELMQGGQLVFLKLGKSRRVPKASLINFLQEYLVVGNPTSDRQGPRLT